MRDLSGRIAVCFSGQIRTGVEVALILKNYFDEMYGNIDFFIHTWTTESLSPWTTQANGDVSVMDVHIPVDYPKFAAIRELYNPMRMIVDDYASYKKTHRQQAIQSQGACFAQLPVFMSAYEANCLKKQYEHRCKSQYGTVLKMRMDTVFRSGLTLMEELHHRALSPDTFYYVDVANKFPAAIEDMVWMSSSSIMDTAIDFEIVRSSAVCEIDWQHHMKDYLREQGINFRPFKNNSMAICRDYHVDQELDLKNIDILK